MRLLRLANTDPKRPPEVAYLNLQSSLGSHKDITAERPSDWDL
jgi:hypothetical protein